MYAFTAVIDIIGINPFVFVPDRILEKVFADAGKNKGAIPVHGSINEQVFKQTLVKYSGHWRLYINTAMLAKSPERIGETIKVKLAFDSEERAEKMHDGFVKALQKNKTAKKVFDSLPPSRQKELVRYINKLKTQESVERNISRAINFLEGKERFIGRDKP